MCEVLVTESHIENFLELSALEGRQKLVRQLKLPSPKHEKVQAFRKMFGILK